MIKVLIIWNSLSFFYGLLDKQCSLSFDKNASSQSSALYQRKLQSKLNLVAAMREEHEKIIASILSKSDQIHYGSYGTTLWTNFILSKSGDWFKSEKESDRLSQAGCSQVATSNRKL